MAGNNAEETVIAAGGAVYLAPTGTPGPTTEVSALNAGFVDLGFIDSDGVELEVGEELFDLEAWNNGGYPVRSSVTGRSFKATFNLEQLNGDTVPLALGGGSWSGGGGAAEVQAVVLTGFAGTDQYHLSYGGQESALIIRGTNHTAAGIKTAIEGISGVTFTVTVSDVTDEGFLVTWDAIGTRTALSVTNPTGVTGVVGTLVDGAAAAGASYVFTPPASTDAKPTYSMVIEWQDGDVNNRIYIPMGQKTNTVTTQLTREDGTKLPIEFEARPDGTDDAYRWYSDSPAFA